VDPSPKLHDHDVGLPADVSVNVIVCPLPEMSDCT